ncbi:hypothetical protein HS088_TW09G01148 [Tripterygium wilfordii]|uniref:Stress-response A/B barrel domain-containing protein n=1 Tax=Tripterygium wilfordii TaxID=458696 RepID=A0A7J7D9R7_TRIWF|nr:stress-response A/B barrel domain-containing protein UP3-like [Tripterygium wilfordii]KAF5743083.1 hypothetical protein HS088_TW09G01148 [Tripterygium wilfordii]
MTMQSLRLRASPLVSFTLSSPKHRKSTLPFLFKPYCQSSTPSVSKSLKMSTVASPSTVIEHVVLFKVKDNTEPSKVNAMVTGLNGLISLDQVLHLTAGPLFRTRSPLSNFTHMLHSRYSSKDDLSAYSAHPSHLGVVRENVFPICDDIMAVDWVAPGFEGPLVPSAGSAVRVSFLKLKENVAEEGKNELLGVIKGIKESFGGIDQITCGENFSPARAKGFSIASLAVFPGLSEMEAADSKEELVNLHKEKVRDYLEGVIVVDYVVPSTQPASL